MNPWLALTPGDDPAERIRQVGRAHERFLAGQRRPELMRAVVAESWARSAAWVGADSTPPVELCDDELQAYRAAHPLARVMPIFRDLLGGLAEDGDHILAVCDAHGRLLWVEGNAGTLRGVASMNFVPGARWDEAHAGTNAPGTALAVDHALQIFATEHFNRSVQRWTCTAAPIHDPGTGRLLGAIDVTGGDHLANPHSLALVRATALAAEAYLYEPPRATSGPAVTALGRDEAVLVSGNSRTKLSRRHSELLILLAAHPEGRTGDQLTLDLYGDDLNPVTVRAEMSRLRRILGPELLRSRPYRLQKPMKTDLGEMSEALAGGNLAEALRNYPGPLLPGSDAPGIVRLRRLLDDRLRTALLHSADPHLLREWLSTPHGADDLALWEAYAVLTPGDPLTSRRITELSREYACNVSATYS
ncbi:diguanylate cyclase [Actinoplanes sp. SE50]|uniref:helix-turn-helix domain-containing protein n=1 Tax=unclassified Actinoplanes TaxID=2626549 RepID=UPI00023EC716|nr:putative 47.3 kDa protein in thcA 5'region [Actinoplanes sp. SE50/110]ATO80354.1 diguanylate cyclase [Actinoplanes sp. SE50]SLL97760.1 diguanylate cyclase [Actinoplanes sp. SE50/110]